MHQVNAGYTLLLPVVSESAATDFVSKMKLPFEQSKTTHFATVTVIPAQAWNDHALPATLLFATSYAGPTRAHLDDLFAAMLPELRALFAHCAEYEASWSVAELRRWIEKRRYQDTFYSGMPDLTPQCVRRHHALRLKIEAFLDDTPDLPTDPKKLRARIRAHVDADPAFAWTHEPGPSKIATFFARYYRILALGGALGALVAATIAAIFNPVLWIPVGIGWAAVVGFALALIYMLIDVIGHEKDQTYFSKRQPDAFVRDLSKTQLRAVINDMVIAGPVKEESRLRPPLMRIAMWGIARYVEGIPFLDKIFPVLGPMDIPTVATARWIPADNGRRLIFISNFTNAAEPYARDFIDVPRGAQDINLTFGWGRGYPRTRKLAFDGAITDPNGFMNVVSEHQKPTGYWYGPYTDISIDNIRLAQKIREGLWDDSVEDQAWLHLL